MRWISGDGRWAADQIRLTLTGSGRDGQWLRVREYGFYAGEMCGRGMA